MTTWEYRHITLGYEVGEGTDTGSPREAMNHHLSEMTKAGAEGWEAIGQVNITIRSTDIRGLSKSETHPALLLKRPKD